jgi:hypothetical protein
MEVYLKKKKKSIDFSMVLGDIFTIVIAIIANNYKSLNLRQFSKILKIQKLKACKFCSVGFIIVGFQDTALLPNLKQKAISFKMRLHV